MKPTEKEQKLAVLRIAFESRYGNYVPTEESEAEIAKIYQEAVDKVNKEKAMSKEEVIEQLLELKIGHWTEKSADAIAQVLDEYLESNGIED